MCKGRKGRSKWNAMRQDTFDFFEKLVKKIGPSQRTFKYFLKSKKNQQETNRP